MVVNIISKICDPRFFYKNAALLAFCQSFV